MVGEHVTLRFRGLMLEKFLSRALSEGVVFECVQRTGRREARLMTDEAGAKALLRLAERFSLDVRTLRRRGAGAWLCALKRHFTYPIALLFAFLLAFFFLQRLWVIEIRPVGTGAGAKEIRAALNAQGVCPGMSLRAVEPDVLRARLLAALPDYAFIGVERRGVALTVSAARALDPPDLYDPAVSRDLVAVRDAQVLQVDALSGTPIVKPGDVVLRGQTLILGQERDTRAGGTRGVCALGAVTGRVFVSGTAQASRSAPSFVPTGRVRYSSALVLAGLRLPILRAQPFEQEKRETQTVEIGGLLAPLRLSRTRHIEGALRPVLLGLDKIKKEISEIAQNEALLSAPEGLMPVDKWTDYSMIEGGRIRARAVLEFHVNVAAARETR